MDAYRPALVVTGHLSLVRSLARHGVPAWCVEYDESHYGSRSRFSAGRIEAPSPLDDPDGFVHRMMGLGPEFDGSLLIPMFDASLVAISQYHEELSRRFVVATEPWPTTRIYLEKERTAALAAQLGIAAPRSVKVTRSDDITSAVEGLTPPFVLKPNLTHAFNDVFGSKMFHADTEAEAEELCSRALDHGFEVSVQEFIPGPPAAGVVYAAYFADGEALVEVTHRKVRDGPPTWGSPRVCVTDTIPEILEPGRALMEATGFTGYTCIEFKLDDRDGQPKLMEVNARHNLAGTLHTDNGVDMPWIQYQHLVLGKRPGHVAQPPDGRYWVDIQRDLGYSWMHRKTEGLSFADYVRPYRAKTSYRTFAWSDPRPFISQFASRVGRRLHR